MFVPAGPGVEYLAGYGKDWRVTAMQGVDYSAGRCMAGRCLVRSGDAWIIRSGTAWFGGARPGGARQGDARRGLFGLARRGTAGLGRAGRGAVWIMRFGSVR